ncbi:hypothetical protein H8K90_01130 [Winogradskyella echinorum]|jgi:hypothetical protein|uniref:HTH cro/C1-type domain-containing protein n=1 Tax=Winogradskyella echinorum TaxID=538189 RepID=A0ABR6XY99_9FLAO|nr:hypothetical protein [Winogradskyella echinorum]MBC3844968.1 hypothetical protein [Winogradskyella echinorum]MBC5749316.1 hypothetical protein [Winogradskyella echinorum]
MKENPQYDEIDLKFVNAVDEVIAVNSELGIKPNNDSSIGKEVYPTNRSIVSAVRSRSKHIPHLALINFAKRFNVDMNYFYNETPLQYQPPTITNITVKKNGISSTGNNATNIHAGKGKIKGINNAEAGSKNTLVEVVEVNTMINNFISQIDGERVKQFLTIISKIQVESKSSSEKLERILIEKSEEIKEMRISFKEEMGELREELKETREKLDISLKREVDLLRELLNERK